MAFQAGLAYWDRRNIEPHDQALAEKGIRSSDCGFISTRVGPGVVLSAAASSDSLSRRSHSQSGWLTFDGKLHNRSALIDSLDSTGRDFSDADLAIRAYQRKGVDGLSYLVGDWSLAIWSPSTSTLILASDFAGVRPLYYSHDGRRIIWSTRLSHLIEWTNSCAIDDTFVAGFLEIGGCPERTPFRGIRAVPVGQAVIVRRGGLEKRRFWDLPIGDVVRFRCQEDYDDHFRHVFREAVHCRLPSGCAPIAELSGGLDSSSVVCMADQLIRSGVPASRLRTLSFDHDDSLDRCYWTPIERACEIDPIRQSIDRFPFVSEGHAGNSAPSFWAQLQARTAGICRQHGVTTYLTGNLGDLIMANWQDDSDQLAGLLRVGRWSAAFGEALRWSKSLRVPIYSVLTNALKTSLPRWFLERQSRSFSSGNSGIDRKASISPEFRKLHPSCELAQFFSKAWLDAAPERRKLFRALTERLETRSLQAPEPLEHLDYTHPFSDRRLITFMLAIPPEIACRPGEARKLHRRALSMLWPSVLRKRRSKDSFGRVFATALRPLARNLLLARSMEVAERGYVDPADFRRRLTLLVNSMECNESQLSRIILLEYWLRNLGRKSWNGSSARL